MRALAIAYVLAVLATSPVVAQSPVPDSVRSSSLTRAQEAELNRRLAQLQQRFSALARETDLREAAVRNVATEIFGADPSLDFESYVSLIDRGVRELRAYLSDARARSDADPSAAAIRQRAIAAAEDGRLSDARALYDQLIAANRSARRRARAQEDLADAADMAESAELAFVAGDYLDAARRAGEAADLAPEGARQRWEYTLWRATALYHRGIYFGEATPLREAVAIHETALAIAPGPADWAETQHNLGLMLSAQGGRGVPGAFERAVTAYEAALTVQTRQANPTEWARLQTSLGTTFTRQGLLERAVAAYMAALSVMTREADPFGWAETQTHLGTTLMRMGERGDPGALEAAIAAHEAALTVRTRDAAPLAWAQTQHNLANALRLQGERGDLGALERAVEAYQAVLAVDTRERNPVGWALTQHTLGTALRIQGERGQPDALDRAVSAYEAALTVRTREANPAGWASTTYNLALTYRALGQRDTARTSARGALEAYEQIGNAYWTDKARELLTELEAE